MQLICELFKNIFQNTSRIEGICYNANEKKELDVNNTNREYEIRNLIKNLSLQNEEYENKLKESNQYYNNTNILNLNLSSLLSASEPVKEQQNLDLKDKIKFKTQSFLYDYYYRLLINSNTHNQSHRNNHQQHHSQSIAQHVIDNKNSNHNHNTTNNSGSTEGAEFYIVIVICFYSLSIVFLLLFNAKFKLTFRNCCTRQFFFSSESVKNDLYEMQKEETKTTINMLFQNSNKLLTSVAIPLINMDKEALAGLRKKSIGATTNSFLSFTSDGDSNYPKEISEIVESTTSTPISTPDVNRLANTKNCNLHHVLSFGSVSINEESSGFVESEL